MSRHKFYSLVVKNITQNTKDCITVTFDIPNELNDIFWFIAGQYLTLRRSIGGEELRRSYSISSVPGQADITIAIKKLPGGKFSTYAHEVLKKGDKIDVMSPSGNFTIDPNVKNVVFFAAGSGITPIISQISDLLNHTQDTSLTLIYSNKNFESIIFREELEGLKNKYLNRLAIHHVFSKEKTGLPLFFGRIDKDKCALMSKSLFDISNTDGFMICGPNDMIFNVRDALLDQGVAESKIHYELFNSAGLKNVSAEKEPLQDSEKSKESNITVQMDGDVFEFSISYSGQNLLDAAIAHGADLPYSCKGGVCSTCKAKITEGKVEMDLNYALEPYEIDAGYVLLCQSHPRSPKVYIDLDQK
ncbi:MAG: 2Fe-2S iron-sulfur cluster-binding protein [Saprospiraceae bacterium]|jgi:ring-1,2-phenylacetyl-CoA epoxidase subunit PaaE|nr:2Fe-2S iron-sulfur cluster binding domain-containing protein [Saprospiraceae bacterium]MBP6446141.1 2Fe-2S iron-sulfur cluster binding domain-containing protein [Saprospiraceae bacterium]